MSFSLLSARPTRFLAALAAIVALLFLAAPVWAQDHAVLAEDSGSAAHESVSAAHGEHAVHAAEHGLPQAAPVLFKIGPLPVNSSMVLTWAVAIGIIIFAQRATRNIKEIPEGAQNFWEFLVESLRDFLENIIGRHLTAKTYWFFASIFIFILFVNWFGLVPGVGTIGWGVADAQGQIAHIEKPLLRGAGADLNLTLAMALVFFACWTVWAFQANGAGGFLIHIFGPKGSASHWLMKYTMIVVFALVGVLEVVSILFRPVSLSFRLYGNVFAGENMLEAMSHIVPALAPIIPIPFYFLELLVGLVQALVFMLLTAVFTLLICSHGEEPHSGHH